MPDLPGCVAAANSREDVLALIKEAIEFHIEGLPVLIPSSAVELVEVKAA